MSDNIRDIKSHRPRRTLTARIFRGGGLILASALSLALFAALGAVLARSSDKTLALFDFIVRYRVYAYAMQLALTGCLWLYWGELVSWLAMRRVWPESARDMLLQRKGKWLAVLLAFQLILLASAVSELA